MAYDNQYFIKMHLFKRNLYKKQGLQMFPEKVSKPLTREILKSYLKEYCQKSSLHGIHYLDDSNLKSYEKIIWLLILVATSLATIFIYFELSELYFTERIQTTISDSVRPIFYVPFPSVGICTKHRINHSKLDLASKLYLPENATNDIRKHFINFFEALDSVIFGKFEGLADFPWRSVSNTTFAYLNKVNIHEVMKFLRYDCDQIFLGKCTWRKKPYNCCEIFPLERTEAGFCYVFNSAVDPALNLRSKQDKYYPYRNSKNGEGSGLNFMVTVNGPKEGQVVNHNNGSIFAQLKGVYVMIKHSDQWHDDVQFVEQNTYTKVTLYPQLTSSDPRIKDVEIEERKCFFDDEDEHPLFKKIPGLVYWKGNCRTRCHQEHVLKHCNCSPSFLFPNSSEDNFPECKVSDFECIFEHRKMFEDEYTTFEEDFIDEDIDESMVCTCVNSCSQLLYDRYFTPITLTEIYSNASKDQIYFDIYYSTNYFIKYYTSMRFTFVELIASFGGIIGLFLGASLLSGIELIYYLTIGLYSRLKSASMSKKAKRIYPISFIKKY